MSSNAYGLSVGVLGDVGQAMQVTGQVRSARSASMSRPSLRNRVHLSVVLGDSGNGACFGGYEANIEAFTELQ